MMRMDHAGHECCWGGAQGVVGGLHLACIDEIESAAIWQGSELIGCRPW